MAIGWVSNSSWHCYIANFDIHTKHILMYSTLFLIFNAIPNFRWQWLYKTGSCSKQGLKILTYPRLLELTIISRGQCQEWETPSLVSVLHKWSKNIITRNSSYLHFISHLKRKHFCCVLCKSCTTIVNDSCQFHNRVPIMILLVESNTCHTRLFALLWLKCQLGYNV